MSNQVLAGGPISMIVRTYSKTTFLSVSTMPLYSDHSRQARAKAVPLAALDSSSTGDNSLVDIALNGQGSVALLTNSQGQLFTAEFREGGAMRW